MGKQDQDENEDPCGMTEWDPNLLQGEDRIGFVL